MADKTEILKMFKDRNFISSLNNLIKNSTPKNANVFSFDEETQVINIGKDKNITINLINGDISLNGPVKLGKHGALLDILGVKTENDNQYLAVKVDGNQKYIQLLDGTSL